LLAYFPQSPANPKETNDSFDIKMEPTGKMTACLAASREEKQLVSLAPQTADNQFA